MLHRVIIGRLFFTIVTGCSVDIELLRALFSYCYAICIQQLLSLAITNNY